MQLKWEGENEDFEAQTPFGYYWIQRCSWKGLTWSYWFGDSRDKGEFPAENVEKAKAAANEHWQDRIAPIVAPYLDVKEAARTLAMVENIDQIAQACAEYGVATPKVVAILRALEAQEGGDV